MSQQAQETVVVPREPTEAMLQGGCAKHKPGEPMSDKWHEECPSFVSRRKIWADMIAAAPVSPDSDLLKEAVGLLRMFDKHLGEDDGFWTDNSTIRPEWFDEGVRRSLTFGMFRQVRTFLSKVGDATHG